MPGGDAWQDAACRYRCTLPAAGTLSSHLQSVTGRPGSISAAASSVSEDQRAAGRTGAAAERGWRAGCLLPLGSSGSASEDQPPDWRLVASDRRA